MDLVYNPARSPATPTGQVRTHPADVTLLAPIQRREHVTVPEGCHLPKCLVKGRPVAHHQGRASWLGSDCGQSDHRSETPVSEGLGPRHRGLVDRSQVSIEGCLLLLSSLNLPGAPSSSNWTAPSRNHSAKNGKSTTGRPGLTTVCWSCLRSPSD